MPHHNITLISPTGRLRLVPPNAGDDEAAAILRSHPVTRRFLRFLPENVSVEEMAARRESRAEDSRILDFHVHLLNDGGTIEFVGMTGVFNIDYLNNSCEAGIVISPDIQGKGVATETLYILLEFLYEQRKFHRVTFETGADNIIMQNWLGKVAGARLEAERKECWKDNNGAYSDVRGYSILEWEWRDRVKASLKARLHHKAV